MRVTAKFLDAIGACQGAKRVLGDKDSMYIRDFLRAYRRVLVEAGSRCKLTKPRVNLYINCVLYNFRWSWYLDVSEPIASLVQKFRENYDLGVGNYKNWREFENIVLRFVKDHRKELSDASHT